MKGQKAIIVDKENRTIRLSMQSDRWKIENTSSEGDKQPGSITIKNNKGLWIDNGNSEKIKICYKTAISIKDKKITCVQIRTKGRSIKNGGLDVQINGWSVPEDGLVNMPLQPPIDIMIALEANADSCGIISDIQLDFLEDVTDLTERCQDDRDILIVTPDYPSNHNLYLAAFAHSRNRVYAEKGLKIQVAALSVYRWYSTSYEFEGIPVIMGHTSLLKKLLSKKQYKMIIVHFADVEYYQIFDGYISDEQLIFICHGPETTFKLLPNVSRPYFTAPLPENRGENPVKEYYVKKYSRKNNVHWVFVSEWLKEKSEESLNVKFLNCSCIGNIIDENNFPYVQKSPDDRKKILVLRKFDNIQYHSIDIVVRTILALSHKEYFEELEFDIYGDGDYYDKLTAPIKDFANVHLHRTFIRNSEIKNIHKTHGIMLIPSRHDSQGVSIGEAASSGVVPLGSKVTCLPYFLDDEHTHVLSDPEDPDSMVETFEKFYFDPERFLNVSKELSHYVQRISGREQTIEREIELIKRLSINTYDIQANFNKLQPEEKPILTIVVPAYNVEKYIEKCVLSLVNHRNAEKCEILIINDGSKDNTSVIGHKYQEMTNGIVKVIDKENGGHGSTINKGIEIAKGKYIKLIDGDDWVDSENLAKLVDVLSAQDADLFLTKGCYEYADKASLDNIIDYDSLTEGVTYHYSDLLYPVYGFDTYGPLLTTSTYRTDILRKAAFKLSEKKPYVDMEFNVFSQQYIDTVKYYDLDIYRYLIGRSGQTVSRDYWKGHYKDHEYVIFNILKYLDKKKEYSEQRKQYAYRQYIAKMVDSQIFMFDQLASWDELEKFLEKLKHYPLAYKVSLEYIKDKKDASIYILNNYKKFISESRKEEPVINMDGTHRLDNEKSKILPVVRAIVPYGMISLWRKYVVPKLWEKAEK